MKHYIFTDGVETHIVQSIEGYETWTKLGEHTGEVEDACVFDKKTKKLKRCAETHAKRERQAKLNPEKLLDLIEALEARVAQLEAQLAKGSNS